VILIAGVKNLASLPEVQQLDGKALLGGLHIRLGDTVAITEEGPQVTEVTGPMGKPTRAAVL
jgi:hypothetical protein